MSGIKKIAKSVLAWFIISLAAYIGFVASTFFELDKYLNPRAQVLLGDMKNLSANIVASFILYYLVVYLPTLRRRRILRSSCRNLYLNLKEEILGEIISSSWKGGREDIGLVIRDSLMNPVEFNKCFEGGREANEGLYALMNHLQSNEGDFRLIVSKFKMIAHQVEYVLNNLEFDDQTEFDHLKWIEKSLLGLDELHADYDDVKVLTRVIWEIFGGWSMIDGYRNFDPILQMIDEI